MPAPVRVAEGEERTVTPHSEATGTVHVHVDFIDGPFGFIAQ
jgi:hypothetical protein